MHRRWVSLPLLSSVVSAFYPLPRSELPISVDVDLPKRFFPISPESAKSDPGSTGTVVKADLTKVAKRSNTFPIVYSTKPSAPNALAINEDGSDYSYFSTVLFGSKGQSMNMLIDTGSANTWVMGEDCTSQACTLHNLFGADNSSTLQTTTNTWNLAYGTGQVEGIVASDTVAFANYSFTMGFGLANNVSSDFSNYPMDGILGLGPSSSNQPNVPNVPTLIEVLSTAGKMASKVIGVKINRASDSKDGEIMFGGIDLGKFSGSLTFTPTANNNGWEIPVDDVTVNGTPSKFTGKTAIIDTGTSYILMPSGDAQVIHNMISGSAQNGETFTIPCSSAETIQVVISGVPWTINPKDYVGKPTGSNSLCSSNIIGHQAYGPNQWILGDTFLKNVYAVFDFDQSQVGFGAPGSGGSSPAGIAAYTPSSSPSASASSPTSSGSSTSKPSSSSTSSSAAASSSAIDPGNPYDNGNMGSDTPTPRKSSAAAAPAPAPSGVRLLSAMLLAFVIGLVI